MTCRRRRGATAAAGAGALLLLTMTIAFPPRVHAQHEKYATGAQWKAVLSQGNTGKSSWFSRWYVCMIVRAVYKYNTQSYAGYSRESMGDSKFNWTRGRDETISYLPANQVMPCMGGAFSAISIPATVRAVPSCELGVFGGGGGVTGVDLRVPAISFADRNSIMFVSTASAKVTG